MLVSSSVAVGLVAACVVAFSAAGSLTGFVEPPGDAAYDR